MHTEYSAADSFFMAHGLCASFTGLDDWTVNTPTVYPPTAAEHNNFTTQPK